MWRQGGEKIVVQRKSTGGTLNLNERKRAVSLLSLVPEADLGVRLGHLYGALVRSRVFVLNVDALGDEPRFSLLLGVPTLHVASVLTIGGHRQYRPHALLVSRKRFLHVPHVRKRARIGHVDDQPVGQNACAFGQGQLAVAQPLLINTEVYESPAVGLNGLKAGMEGALLVSVPLLKVVRVEGHALKPDDSLSITRHGDTNLIKSTVVVASNSK